MAVDGSDRSVRRIQVGTAAGYDAVGLLTTFSERQSVTAIKPSLAEDASPEAFAEAMMRCQIYAPACSDHRECGLDGWCFGRDGQGFAKARRQISKLIDDESNIFTRSFLKLAMDAIDHHRFIGQRSMDALRLIAINKEVRRQYGAKEPQSR
jgi:hypothetical protein